MSKTKYQPISKLMMSAQVMLDNALDEPEILDHLATFGYDETKLYEGKALYDAALELVHQQKAGYGEQYDASTKVRATWDEAKVAYMRTLKVARIAFKNNSKAQTALMLRGKRKQTLAGWLGQASTFYANLLASADLMVRLAEFGYDHGKIEAEAGLVQTVIYANVSQEQEKGNAREITQLRNGKLEELDVWIAEFRAIAKIALQDQPYLLDKLGL